MKEDWRLSLIIRGLRMLLFMLVGNMSYFIGVLIFVATLATTDTAFAADHLIPIHDAAYRLLFLLLGIIIFFTFVGWGVSLVAIGSAYTDELSPFQTASDRILRALSGGILGVILGAMLERFTPSIEAIAIGFAYGAIFGITLGGTGTGLSMIWGVILGAVLGLFIALVTAFVGIASNTTWLAIFCDWLGTKEKKDTLTFIGGIIGGILAVINAIMIYFRSKSQDNNNKLVEKGHVEDRFRFASQALESKNPVTLISAFYQFYYLAKHLHIHDFKKNIFNVLCSYLRDIDSKSKTGDKIKTHDEKYILKTHDEKDMLKTHDEKGMPTEHYQKLLNVLFMPDDNSPRDFYSRLRELRTFPRFFSGYNSPFPFAEFNADLKNVNFSESELPKACFTNGIFEKAHFTNANLSNANLKGADLSEANFSGANLSEAKFQNAQLKEANLKEVLCVEKADFCDAKIGDRDIKEEDLPPQHEKGEYYADWNPPPRKEEDEDIIRFFCTEVFFCMEVFFCTEVVMTRERGLEALADYTRVKNVTNIR